MNTATSRVLAVIPARLASTRLPEKAIRDIGGKTMIQRVWEQAQSAKRLDRVVVATDSELVFSKVSAFGGEALLTDAGITTGTERVAAAASLLTDGEWDIVVNLQGDMPFIRGELIDRVVGFCEERGSEYSMVTAATPIFDEEAFCSSSNVKVVISEQNEALYFSRSPVPFSRDGDRMKVVIEGTTYSGVFGLKHFGLYVFQPSALDLFRTPDFSRLERIEKLEQLRLLDHGIRVGVCLIEPELTENSVEVDTLEDLTYARKLIST